MTDTRTRTGDEERDDSGASGSRVDADHDGAASHAAPDQNSSAAIAPGPIGVVREIEPDVTNLRELAVAGMALFILLATVPLAARAAGSLWILAYAAAVAAWWTIVRAWSPRTLNHVFAAAATLHLPLLLQAPLAAATNPSGHGPVAALLADGLAASGAPLVAARVLVVLATATGTWLLWRGGRPRRALGFATFPLLAIEGTLNGRLEIVGAVLLFAAALLVRRNREGWSGLTSFTAVAMLVPGVTLLPALWDQAYHVAPFIGAALFVIVSVKLALPAESVWTGAVTGWIASSASLAVASEWLAMRLAMWGAADFLDDLSARAQERSGMTWSWRFDDGVIALLAVFVAVIVIATVAARWAKTPDESAADTLGATLLVSAALEPAMWLLVVPFAIAANRTLWFLIALCAPVLYLGREHGSPWIAYAVSLAVPVTLWLQIRAGANAVPEERPVAA